MLMRTSPQKAFNILEPHSLERGFESRISDATK